MKSKELRWYKRHKRALNTVLNTVAEKVSGGDVLKNNLHQMEEISKGADDESMKERVAFFEKFIREIKPVIFSVVGDIEEIDEDESFTEQEELTQYIKGNEKIQEELTEALPELSASILGSIDFIELPKESTQKNNTEEYSMNKEEGNIIGGKYQLYDLLGGGGQGTVYKAYDTIVDKYVAIKIIPEHISSDATLVDRLKQEYRRLTENLSHRHIVQYRDIDKCTGRNQWFLVMDYIEGETLRAEVLRARRKGIEKEKVYQLLEPIAEALEYAHSKEIIHNDLKPENILVANDGSIYLTDFGLAHENVVEENDSDNFIGTVAYMSPQQFQGRKDLKENDIWALGVIMYEMLEGEHPFRGMGYEHYKHLICNQDAEPLEDDALWNVISHALVRDHTKRINSAKYLISRIIENKKQPKQEVMQEASNNSLKDKMIYMDSVKVAGVNAELTAHEISKAQQLKVGIEEGGLLLSVLEWGITKRDRDLIEIRMERKAKEIVKQFNKEDAYRLAVYIETKQSGTPKKDLLMAYHIYSTLADKAHFPSLFRMGLIYDGRAKCSELINPNNRHAIDCLKSASRLDSSCAVHIGNLHNPYSGVNNLDENVHTAQTFYWIAFKSGRKDVIYNLAYLADKCIHHALTKYDYKLFRREDLSNSLFHAMVELRKYDKTYDKEYLGKMAKCITNKALAPTHISIREKCDILIEDGMYKQNNMAFLGREIIKGNYGKYTIEDGLTLYERGIREKNVEMLLDLSDFLFNGKYLKKNLKRSLELYETVLEMHRENGSSVYHEMKHKRNYLEAHCLYEEYTGTEYGEIFNTNKRLHEYFTLFFAKHEDAPFYIGRMYEGGLREAPKDLKRAAEYYKIGQVKGDNDSIIGLRRIFQILAPNTKEFMNQCYKASAVGDAESWYQLGEIYFNGTCGVREDKTRAEGYYMNGKTGGCKKSKQKLKEHYPSLMRKLF